MSVKRCARLWDTTLLRELRLFQHTEELLLSLMIVVSKVEHIHDDSELRLDVLSLTLDLLELVLATQEAKPLLAVTLQVSHVDCLVSYMHHSRLH